MKIFGKRVVPGAVRYSDGRTEIRAEVRPLPGGFLLTGSVAGRPGRIEIMRESAPPHFLMNNWQSWGPIQAMSLGERLAGLDERMANYSRYVFTPVPDEAARALLSDYFIGGPGWLVGFLSSRIAHPYFAIEGKEIVGYVEYFGAEISGTAPLEPLLVLSQKPLERLLESYADQAAIENGVRAPRVHPVGWSSWYQYFTGLTSADIEKNLKIARDGFAFDVFQIDDGYEADIGDWLQTKPGFGDLAGPARMIREAGYTAGIWTAPFSASDSSELFRRHPGWFVRKVEGEDDCPVIAYRNWGKDIHALDTTHPEALAWLRTTFTELKRMGFAYFKIDFLFSAAVPGRRFLPVTPIEAYRKGLAAIRDSVGSDFILACGAPLLPSLGLVDGMRVGEDTAPFWDPAKSGVQGPNAKIAIKNPILRWFMHRRWWLNDPDCLLLRDRDIRLQPNERELYARAAGVLDAMLIDSDDLELVSPEGKALFAEAVALQGGRVGVNGVLEDDLYEITSAGGPAGKIRLAVNLSETARTLAGKDIPARTAVFL
ncbi:MAG: glycoside hydrolase family 36 protein [Candidatus Aminicenantales bacterium]